MKKIILAVIVGILVAGISQLAFAGYSWDSLDREMDTLGRKLERLTEDVKELEKDFDIAEAELGKEKLEFLKLKLIDIQKDIEFSREDRRELLELIQEAQIAIGGAESREEKEKLKEKYFPEIEQRKTALENEYDDIQNRLDITRGEFEKAAGDIEEIKKRHEARKKAEMGPPPPPPPPPIWKEGLYSISTGKVPIGQGYTIEAKLRGKKLDLVVGVDGTEQVKKDNGDTDVRVTAWYIGLETRGFGIENVRFPVGVLKPFPEPGVWASIGLDFEQRLEKSDWSSIGWFLQMRYGWSLNSDCPGSGWFLLLGAIF